MSTFYVHLLNPAPSALTQVGLFDGAITADETAVTTILNLQIAAADVSQYFKFKSDSVLSGDGDDATIDVVGLDYAGTAAWTFPAAGDADADGLATDFLPLLAAKVFGSAGAVDLFSNGDKIITSWHTAAASAKASLNAKTSTAGTSASASKELIDAMFYNALSERFAMDYNAVLAGATFGDEKSVSGGSGSGAKMNVAAHGLSVHTAGSGYLAGDSITLPGVPAFVINSVQAAMLNGALSTTGAAVPLEAGDKIRVIYEIRSASTQNDASGDALDSPVQQKFKVDYELI